MDCRGGRRFVEKGGLLLVSALSLAGARLSVALGPVEMNVFARFLSFAHCFFMQSARLAKLLSKSSSFIFQHPLF